MFVVYTVIAMVHMIYIMMFEYDSLQMLNAMLVAINTIRAHSYIHIKINVNIYSVGFLFTGEGFISSKLSLTLDLSYIFVVYT